MSGVVHFSGVMSIMTLGSVGTFQLYLFYFSGNQVPATEGLTQKEKGKGTMTDAALMMKNQLGKKPFQN